MKILSLFDGISVAQQAFKELGFEVEYYASEIDKYAIQITQKNFPKTIQLGSVEKVYGRETCLVDDSGIYNEPGTLVDIDLIIGGSPCQDLSIAKKNREGLKGARSGLFYEYVRILNEVKPKYFVLENVNLMPKEAKETITKELFGIEPVMINASLVSAQQRKRLFWIGKLVNGKYKKVEIPQPKDKGILLKDILLPETYTEFDKSFALTKLYNGAVLWNSIEKSQRTMVWNKPIRVGHFKSGGQGQRVYSIDGKSVTLSALGGGWGAKTGLYAVAQRGRNIVNGKRKDILGAKTKQRIEVGGTEKAHTITTVQKDSMVMDNQQIRKLTPIECERLQSLPDNFTAKGINEKGEVDISNTQRYKALGNAFNCEVIKHILDNLTNNI